MFNFIFPNEPLKYLSIICWEVDRFASNKSFHALKSVPSDLPYLSNSILKFGSKSCFDVISSNWLYATIFSIYDFCNLPSIDKLCPTVTPPSKGDTNFMYKSVISTNEPLSWFCNLTFVKFTPLMVVVDVVSVCAGIYTPVLVLGGCVPPFHK